jgi:glycosidase
MRSQAFLTLYLAALASSCALQGTRPEAAQTEAASGITASRNWRQGGVCYEIFVRSFYDSDGDGVGDLNGLIDKLDYVNDGKPGSRSDLGATCIWLMPIAESPSYHGYDVSDYYKVDSEYGTNEDFRRLITEAHKRGIRVLVDLVLNHSSSEHPAFKEAQRDTGSPYRNWFRWLPKHPGVKNRWGGDNWHRSAVRGDYYYGFFWGGMPDLNYENPAVLEEAKKISRFWLLEMGVDGFRLDAIRHLVEDQNGAITENVPATHVVLRNYSAYIRKIAPHAFTIGEVWDSTGAMLAYYPDQLDAHFAFEVSDSIIAAVRSGSARNLFPPLLRIQAAIPAERWAPFLRNHDQTRTLTELGGDIARAKVAATILFTIPGLPFVYYGEEIGMTGNKPDERLRTPMHWRRTRAAGFTTGVPWQPLQPDSLTANVEAQDGDPGSLLNVYRRLIHLRASNPALATGELIPLSTPSSAIAAYLRREGRRVVMVIINLSTNPLAAVTLSSGERVILPGSYVPEVLLGERSSAELRVGSDGRMDGYAPLPVIGGMSGHVFEMRRQGN